MEKTFEELIEKKENVNVPNFIHFNDVLDLLQQVREATIAECRERIIGLEGEIYREGITEVFDEFPTDRITLKD